MTLTGVEADASAPAGADRQQRCAELLWKELEASQVFELIAERDRPNLDGVIEANKSLDVLDLKGVRASATMILSVPDLARVPAGEAFDSSIFALNAAMGSMGYVRDRSVLPAAERPGVRQALHRWHCPGVLLFRAFPARRTHDRAELPPAIAVFTLGESWSSGIDPLAARVILSMIARRKAPGGERELLRVLGPYYSASVESMLAATSEFSRGADTKLHPGYRFQFASGSMSVDRAIATMKRADERFRTYAAPLSERRRTLCAWQHPSPEACAPASFQPNEAEVSDREHRHAPCAQQGPSPEGCANAPEEMPLHVSTVPGRPPATNASLPDREEKRAPAKIHLSTLATLRTIGTTYGHDDGLYKFKLLLAFPSNVAQLRKLDGSGDRARQQKNKAVHQADADDGPKGDRQSDEGSAVAEDRSDLVEWADPEHSSQVYRAAVREAAFALRDNGVNNVFLSSERIGDVVYLGRLLKQETPDLRLIFDHSDQALTRPEYATDLHGSLAVTAYRATSHGGEVLFTISRDQGWGVYYAAQWLWLDSKLPEGQSPHTATCGQSNGAPLPEPKATLAVIAGQRLVPLTGCVQRTTPPVFLAAVLFFMLLALADNARLHRFARSPKEPETQRPEKSPTTNGATPPRGRVSHCAKILPIVDLEPCRNPAVQLGYSALLWVGRCALLGMCLQLIVAYGTSLRDRAWTGYVASLMAVDWSALEALGVMVICAGGLIASLRWSLASWFMALRTFLPDTGPKENDGGSKASAGGAVSEGPACEVDAWTRRARQLGLVGGIVVLLDSVLVASGMMSEGSALSARALDLTCGASPLAVTLLCTLVVYSYATFSARRLRVLDRTMGDSKKLFGEELLERECGQVEVGLYSIATRPTGLRGLNVAFCAVLVVIIATPPLSAWKPRGFTLENPWLHWGIVLGLVLVLASIGLLGAKLWSLYRALTETLCRLAASDLMGEFQNVPWPRTVAQHLWKGWPEEVELAAMLRTFKAREHAHATARPASTQGSGKLPLPQQRKELDCAAGRLRTNLDNAAQRLSEDEVAKDRQAIAGLVAFELATWVRQITALMTSIAIATTGLLLCSWLYVFGVRRLMVTVSTLLTVGAVALGVLILRSLEHDEILSCIGRRASGGVPLHTSWQRFLGMSAFPLLLALASYYPGAWSQVVEWLQSVFSST